MNHGNRAAPIALSRDPPIAKAPCGLLFTQPQAAQVRGDGLDGGLKLQPVVRTRIDAAAMLGIPRRPLARGVFAAPHVDDRLDRQMIFFRECEVPLIVRGHSHDRAVAVAHEHIVADPHRYGLAADGMTHGKAGRDAFFLLGCEFRFDGRAALAFLDERREFRLAARGIGRQRMLRRDRAERDAHERIRARGERVQYAGGACFRPAEVVRKPQPHAHALADPVCLHGAHAFRPPWHLLQGVEQILRIGRDLEVVHRDFTLLDQRAGAPTAAVDHLLVGEHGLVDGIPIDDSGLLVGNAHLQHAQEQPLIPTVVLGTAGGELSAPIQGEA